MKKEMGKVVKMKNQSGERIFMKHHFLTFYKTDYIR